MAIGDDHVIAGIQFVRGPIELWLSLRGDQGFYEYASDGTPLSRYAFSVLASPCA